MRHVLNMLTLILIKGHTDLNHENNKYLVISETIQAMPVIMFAVNTVRLKVYIMTIARSQVRLKLDYFLTYNISDNI